MWDKGGKQLFKSILTKHLLDAVGYQGIMKYPLRNFAELLIIGDSNKVLGSLCLPLFFLSIDLVTEKVHEIFVFHQ